MVARQGFVCLSPGPFPKPDQREREARVNRVAVGLSGADCRVLVDPSRSWPAGGFATIGRRLGFSRNAVRRAVRAHKGEVC
jgi:hypothetical protein